MTGSPLCTSSATSLEVWDLSDGSMQEAKSRGLPKQKMAKSTLYPLKSLEGKCFGDSSYLSVQDVVLRTVAQARPEGRDSPQGHRQLVLHSPVFLGCWEGLMGRDPRRLTSWDGKPQEQWQVLCPKQATCQYRTSGYGSSWAQVVNSCSL